MYNGNWGPSPVDIDDIHEQQKVLGLLYAELYKAAGEAARQRRDAREREARRIFLVLSLTAIFIIGVLVYLIYW